MKNIKVIFEDDHLLVISKPPGLVVNRAESVKGDTVQDWIANTKNFPISKDSSLRNGIVHRLDKDTSGVMLIAKTKPALKNLQKQFHDRKVNKTYIALVHGKLEPAKGQISLPLKRSATNRQSFTVSLSGKMSKTGYQAFKHYQQLKPSELNSKSYQGFSLVNLFPKTGRTHQLRVVLKHLGHPIVGDSKYVGKKRAKADSKWIKRQFLHAQKIQFNHPESNQKITFKAPLPKDLNQSIKLLQPA